MEEKTEFVISREGRIFRRTETLDEIDPGNELQKVFTTSVSTTTRNLLELEGHGPVHLVAQQAENMMHLSVPMNQINFRTTFRAITEGKYKDQLYPSFAVKSSTETMMEIPWVVADAMAKQDASMRIKFHVMCRPHGDGWYAVDHYLYAFDGRGVAYRLPIANLFDTCQVCMGEYNSVHPNLLGCVQKALQQFRTATWNADLFKNANNVFEFIRFKALPNGFETQPISVPWTTMCPKVAPAFVKFCIA